MQSQEKTHVFIISLPHDRHRLESLEKQLRKLNIPFSVVEAVNGMLLSEKELKESYDQRKALRLFNRELSKGEIGCALSHMSIYKKMVKDNIFHALILEDDALILNSELLSILSNLKKFQSEKAPISTILSRSSHYIENKKVQLDDNHCICDIYRAAGTHGYFLTKAAAEILVKHLYPIYVVADKWEHFQERFISVKALVPYAIGHSPTSLVSNIDIMDGRSRKVGDHKNPVFYIKRFIKKITFLIGYRPFIRIKYQEKSKLDLSL